ncbi:MAG: DUF3667 domain-containing protein [Salibacteraceae bacterium]
MTPPTHPAHQRSCIHCRKSVADAYCKHCGQRNGVERLSFKGLWQEYLDIILGLDGRFLRTVVDLTIRPGKVFHAYLKGDRVGYYGPDSYYFLLFTIYLLLIKVFDISIADMIGITKEQMQKTSGVAQGEAFDQQWRWSELIIKYLKFITLVIFPFWAFWAMVVFRKRGYRFVENLAFLFYVVAHPYWIGIFTMLVLGLFGVPLTGLSGIASMGYFIWAALGYFRPKNTLTGLLKIVLLLVLGYVSFILLLAAVTSTIIWLNEA